MSSTGMDSRHVAVLGGSAGIGRETARILARWGARVTIGGRNRDRLDVAVKQLGDRAHAVAVDAEQADSRDSSSLRPGRSATW